MMGTGAGLMYPSVQSHGAINLAVRAEDFDKTFEVLLAEVGEVKNLGFGLYDYRRKQGTCDFDDYGTIIWGSKKEILLKHSLTAGVTAEKDIKGWRVPTPRSNPVPLPADDAPVSRSVQGETKG